MHLTIRNSKMTYLQNWEKHIESDGIDLYFDNVENIWRENP